MNRWSARIGLGLTAGSMMLGVGCAQERDAINRVQTNAFDKTFFVGSSLADGGDDPEFYWRSYVVDASASQSLLGIGEWGHIDRVRWEVTENFLLARKAYEIADHADNKGLTQADSKDPERQDKGFTKTANGTIVAAYKIESQFDIRRSYNPQTGEDLNIIEENTSDRPWQERQYMRVDWSTNMVDTPMQPFFTGRIFGELTVNPVSFYVANPQDEDAPHLDEKSGYFDITNKYSIAPAMTDTGWGFSLPTCAMVGFYTGSSTYECDAQEAVVRHSYLRIDPNHDFEPLENTIAPMDVIANPGGIGDSFSVGVVSAFRSGWDPQYGYTDKLAHRFAYHHNIWKKSHLDQACNDNTDADDDGTADQCAAAGASVGGSQCDVFTKKCTIPYRQRAVKAIGYWVNKESPDELLDQWDAGSSAIPTADKRGTLEDLTYSWNQLMKVAVATSREVECRRTHSGDREACHSLYFETPLTGQNGVRDPGSMEMLSYGSWLVEKTKMLGKVDGVREEDDSRVLTFCHNPVRPYDQVGDPLDANDKEARKLDTCGDVGYKARVGDIRHNFLFYWPYESRAPWGGIANWNGDPLTGEIHGAAAQIMGRSATFAAAQQRDIIQLAIGDLTMDDVIQGVPADRYSRTLRKGAAIPAVPPEERKIRTGSIDLNHLRTSLNVAPVAGDNMKQLRTRAESIMKSSNDVRLQSTAQLEFEALASKLRNSKYEAQMVDSSWLVNAIGASPQTPLGDAVMNLASPLRGLDPGRVQAFRDIMTERLRAKGICFLDDEAPVAGSAYLPSLAGYFKAKYPDGEYDSTTRGQAIYLDLWKEAVKGIALHEVGHSLGMLHQFASSWDAPNYQPQYWQLRGNGQSVGAAKACQVDGDGKLVGRPEDCIGPRYIDPETEDEAGNPSGNGESRPGIQYFANTSTMEYQYERGGETVGLGTFDLHTMKALYGRVLEMIDDRVISPTDQDRQFKFKHASQLFDRDFIGNVDQDRNLKFAHYTTFSRALKVFDPERDCRDATEQEKLVGKWRVVNGKVCAPPPKEHSRWSDTHGGLISKEWNWAASYWQGRQPDTGTPLIRWHYRWGVSHNSYFHTSDSDAGADAYEVSYYTAMKFDQTYPWAYFRRQNREYYYRTIASRTSDRYFDRMRAYHWLIATDLSRLQSAGQLENDDDLKPQAMAQAEVFNLLARALMMPEPGAYFDPTADGDVNARQPAGAIQQIFDSVDGATGTAPAFTIGIVDGRFIGEDFNNDLGGSWDYLTWINHAGFTVEKWRAVEALVDGRPSLFTISRENYLDGRNVKINFRNDSPQAVDRLLGGLLANDWETVAPYVPEKDANPAPTALNIMNTLSSPTRPDKSRILFPNIGYKQQLGSVIFASLFSRLNTDMTLVNKMRIWLDGQTGQINIPPSQQVRFTDPYTGYTYIARKYGNEMIDRKNVEKGIASRMIQYANQILASGYKVDVDGTGKPVLNEFGQPNLVLNGNGDPQIKGNKFSGELRGYVGLLDSVREIGHLLGYGPVSGAEDD